MQNAHCRRKNISFSLEENSCHKTQRPPLGLNIRLKALIGHFKKKLSHWSSLPFEANSYLKCYIRKIYTNGENVKELMSKQLVRNGY
jgi:hypothetical protein